MAGLDRNLLLTRSDEIVETDVMGSPILLHAGNWQYLEFNFIGAAVWNLLRTPQTVDALIAALLERFEVDRETCQTETTVFLRKLLDDGFLIARN